MITDATILTETPPLRASWARAGEQALIPIGGSHANRVLYGTMNIQSGHRLLETVARWNGESFRAHLRQVRRAWRGWRIVLFLDRASGHEAAASRELAAQLGVELRRLPTACPELNPLEGLWRWLKGNILANRQPQPFSETVRLALSTLEALGSSDVLRISGILSGHFWLPT